MNFGDHVALKFRGTDFWDVGMPIVLVKKLAKKGRLADLIEDTQFSFSDPAIAGVRPALVLGVCRDEGVVMLRSSSWDNPI